MKIRNAMQLGARNSAEPTIKIETSGSWPFLMIFSADFSRMFRFNKKARGKQHTANIYRIILAKVIQFGGPIGPRDVLIV